MDTCENRRASNFARARLTFPSPSNDPTSPAHSEPAKSPHAGRSSQSLGMDRDRIRLTYALLLSLLIHILLLRLTFDSQGGLHGLGLRWQAPRFDAAALRVLLVPPDRTQPTDTAPTAKPSPQEIVDEPVSSPATLTRSESRTPTPGTFAAGIAANANASAKPRRESERARNANTTATANPRAGGQPRKRQPRKEVVAGAVPAKPDERAERPENATALPVSPPDVIALDRSDEVTWTVPPAIEQQSSEKAVDIAKQEALPLEEPRQGEHKEEAREKPITQEGAQAESARLEAERQEAARQEAAAREETERQ